MHVVLLYTEFWKKIKVNNGLCENYNIKENAEYDHLFSFQFKII